MHRPYSKRKARAPEQLVYSFDEATRNRIFIVIEDHAGGGDKYFHQLERTLVREYGHLCASAYTAAKVSDDPATEHFFRCSDDQVLDFIEFAFREQGFKEVQEAVDAINGVMQDAGIGFRFSEYRNAFPEVKARSRHWEVEVRFPEAHKITDSHIYETIVRPTLAFLARPEFVIAHDEMMRALASARQGQNEDAITLACAAYESSLKTILSLKGQQYDREKDTCAPLVKRFVDTEMVPPFYEACLVSPATVRNKLSDSHGRGPDRGLVPQSCHTEHMIHVVCANVLLLTTTAQMA